MAGHESVAGYLGVVLNLGHFLDNLLCLVQHFIRRCHVAAGDGADVHHADTLVLAGNKSAGQVAGKEQHAHDGDSQGAEADIVSQLARNHAPKHVGVLRHHG